MSILMGNFKTKLQKKIIEKNFSHKRTKHKNTSTMGKTIIEAFALKVKKRRKKVEKLRMRSRHRDIDIEERCKHKIDLINRTFNDRIANLEKQYPKNDKLYTQSKIDSKMEKYDEMEDKDRAEIKKGRLGHFVDYVSDTWMVTVWNVLTNILI